MTLNLYDGEEESISFERFFNSFYFGRIVGNTLIINFVSLLVGFPVPIIFALLTIILVWAYNFGHI